MSGFGIKDCLTEASLGWKCFGTFNKDREFHTSNDKYFGVLLPELMKTGKVDAFKRFFKVKTM